MRGAGVRWSSRGAPLLLAACALLGACRGDALPPAVTIEEVTAAIAPPVAEGAAVTEPAPGAVTTALVHPGARRPGSVSRRALVTPPGSRVAVPVDLPPDAVLRFSVGVDGAPRGEGATSGIRFRVLIDGRERFVETLRPATSQRHRDWVDGSVALAGDAGRRVTVELETSATDPGLPVSGTPGWSHVRVVRRATRPRQRARPDAPNLLVLLVDTLRADRLGLYGARPSPSPALDAFAGRGLVFDDAAAQSSWTMPSVSTLMTGLHPSSHGAPARLASSPDPAARPQFLAESLTTWAELAQQAGLTTVGVSANPLVSRATNLAQGFETFTDLPWDAAASAWRPAADVNGRFLDWLDRHRAWRFAAYLHYMEPHDPYTPPAGERPTPPAGLDRRLVRGDVTPVARAIETGRAAPLPAETIDYLRRLYDGEIRAWDDALAELLRGLERRGVLDSTLVIVTADHGEEFQEHGRLKHGTQLYEECLRVPLVLVGPGVPVERRRDTAQGIDLLPTIAGALGLEPPAGLPGRNLLATRGAGDVVSETTRGIVPGGGATDLRALRSGTWKLIVTHATGRNQLFDLGADPGERTDRSHDPAGATLRDRLQRWAAAVSAPPRTDGVDPALQDKLRALGYAE